MRELLYILLIVPMLFLAGCETIRSITDRATEVIESNPLIAKTAIQYGTLRFIDGDQEKTEAVVSFVNSSREFLDLSSTSRVDDVANFMKGQINWEDLSVANASLINTLFDTVQTYINRKVEGEDLSPEALVTIHEVLNWIEEATMLSVMGVRAPEYDE
jgi:hypothetical protein